MPNADWYARRLGRAPTAPSTPPINPGRPDTQWAQAPQTQLQRAQEIAQSSAAAGQDALEAARQGQGTMIELASHYQGSKAANAGTGSCPECGEPRLIKPSPNIQPQCWACGWSPRFKAYGG